MHARDSRKCGSAQAGGLALSVLRSSNDASKIVIGESRVMLQIEESLTDNTRGVI